LDPDGYYARLGLDEAATPAEINAAWRAKARVLHPDVPGTGNTAAFLALREAYDILSNPARRERYDRAARQAAAASEPEVAVTSRPRYASRPYAPRQPHVPRPPYTQAAAVPPSRLPGLPVLVWAGLGAFLVLCVTQAVIHLRTVPPVVRADIRPNAVTVAPLSQSDHDAVLYGPAPARLPGVPNFYVTPAGGPAMLYRLDRESSRLVPESQIPPFSSVQAVRLYRQNGLLEVMADNDTTGFIQAGRLAPGNAEAAHRAYCSYNAGPVPSDGEVLERRGRGSATLGIDNRAIQPAVVKLRDVTGSVALSVFLGPGGHADIGGIPAGTYRTDYAIGELWSRACGTFAAGMRAMRMDDAVTIPSEGNLVISNDMSGGAARDIPDALFEER
jgi:hypothetical protein